MTAPSATLWPGKYPPIHRSHIPYLRALHRPPSISICGATNGCDPSTLYFFFNTTGGLIVMPFRLCQEGSWEPMIERIVFTNGSFESEIPVPADASECVTASQGRPT